MRSIKFPQANVELAKNQPEYNSLPAYNGVIGESPRHTGFIVCFEPNEDEIKEIIVNKKIWVSQLTFGHKFNPISLFTTDSVFEETGKVVEYASTVKNYKINVRTPFWKKFSNLFKRDLEIDVDLEIYGHDISVKKLTLPNHTKVIDVTHHKNK